VLHTVLHIKKNSCSNMIKIVKKRITVMKNTLHEYIK